MAIQLAQPSLAALLAQRLVTGRMSKPSMAPLPLRTVTARLFPFHSAIYNLFVVPSSARKAELGSSPLGFPT